MKEDLTIEEIETFNRDIGLQLITSLQIRSRKQQKENPVDGKSEEFQKTSKMITDMKDELVKRQLIGEGDIGKYFHKVIKAQFGENNEYVYKDDGIDANPEMDEYEKDEFDSDYD